jgi:hypothetical protein
MVPRKFEFAATIEPYPDDRAKAKQLPGAGAARRELF